MRNAVADILKHLAITIWSFYKKLCLFLIIYTLLELTQFLCTFIGLYGQVTVKGKALTIKT